MDGETKSLVGGDVEFVSEDWFEDSPGVSAIITKEIKEGFDVEIRSSRTKRIAIRDFGDRNVLAGKSSSEGDKSD